MLQTLAAHIIIGSYLGTGVGFLYKFAQALFGKEDKRWHNMLISVLCYTIFLLIHLLCKTYAF